MQDIGGCRAVVSNIRSVDELVTLYKNSDIKHSLDDEDDYIRRPKHSGYRGVHLIYRYHSDRNDTYNGLKIEMQLRSRLQHAWATAVETVDTFTGQALKASRGEKEWLRFFALMGSAIALRERTEPVPGVPVAEKELKQELTEYTQRLDVIGRLRAYGAALRTLESGAQNARYFLLELNPSANAVTIKGYRFNELQNASEPTRIAFQGSKRVKIWALLDFLGDDVFTTISGRFRQLQGANSGADRDYDDGTPLSD